MERITRKEYNEHRARIIKAKFKIDCKQSNKINQNEESSSSMNRCFRPTVPPQQKAAYKHPTQINFLRKSRMFNDVKPGGSQLNNIDDATLPKKQQSFLKVEFKENASNANNANITQNTIGDGEGDNIKNEMLDKFDEKTDDNASASVAKDSKKLKNKLNESLSTTTSLSLQSFSNSLAGLKSSRLPVSCINLKAELNNLNPRSQRKAVRVLKSKDSNQPPNVNLVVPRVVLRHYEHLTFFMQQPLLLKVLRPLFFVDLVAHSRNYSRPLGRLVFQLFTEACPGLVLAIVRCCNAPNGHEDFQIKRIFDPMWIEGDLNIQKNGIYSNLEIFNENVLSHEIGAGVLSFALPTRTSFNDRDTINFSISFSPLEVPTGRRIALAILSSGFEILREIKKFATKSGKPTDKIEVLKCGMI